MAYNFPGNIRELKALIELAIVLSDGEKIEPENINFPTGDPLAQLLMQDRTLKEYSDKIIQHFLSKYNNNVIDTAKALQIGKSTIYRMLKEESLQV